MSKLNRRMFLGLAAGATLAGCGYRSVDAEYSQPAGSVPKQYANRVRVVFWSSYGGVNGKAVDKIVAKFNDSQQDVYVEVQFQGSYDDVAQKVAAALVAKQAPDLAILSDVMQRADVRMIQSRDRTRLALESIGELGLEDLDRDGAVQSCVAGAVDVAHPTFPDEGGQFVRAKASAWRMHRRRV